MFLLLKTIAFVLGHLPLGLLQSLGRLLGGLVYRLDKKHRKTVLDNLERAYKGGLSAKESERITREVFKNLSTTFFEFMRLPWLKKEDLIGYVECEGMENLVSALSKGRGAIVITAHFGNWELLAAYYALMVKPAAIVIRNLDNPQLERFVSWARTSHGNVMVPKHRALRRLLKTLSENGLCGILLDQNVASVEGVFVDFFGQKACTNKGPAILAEASGAAVLPSFIIRQGGRHRVVIGGEIGLSRTGDRERDISENTARFTRHIEDAIRKYPEQWFWVHRRWKTRPPEGRAGKW